MHKLYSLEQLNVSWMHCGEHASAIMTAVCAHVPPSLLYLNLAGGRDAGVNDQGVHVIILPSAHACVQI
jgi:hypothetical protein